MESDSIDSRYPIQCILPNNRTCVLRCSQIEIESCCHDCSEAPENVSVLFSNNSSESSTRRTMDELETILGFQYCPRLVFMHESDLRNLQFWTFPLDESDSSDIWKRQVLDARHNGKLSIRKLPPNNEGIDLGYGVFAEEDIECSEFLVEYVGLVSKPNAGKAKELCRYSLQYPTTDGGFSVDAHEIGNLSRFFNHSESPNASFRAVSIEGVPHVVAVARQFIVRGSQITVSYGKNYWKFQEVVPICL